MSLCLSVLVFFCLYVCFSVCFSVCLSVCLSVMLCMLYCCMCFICTYIIYVHLFEVRKFWEWYKLKILRFCFRGSDTCPSKFLWILLVFCSAWLHVAKGITRYFKQCSIEKSDFDESKLLQIYHILQ